MICVAALFVLFVGLYLWFGHFLRPAAHTVADVIALIRRVDQQELEDLCSALIEENLRAGLSPSQFQAEQRKRARLLFEYLRRASFNSWVLLSWVHNRQERLASAGLLTGELSDTIQQLIVAGTTLRIHSLVLLAILFQQLVASALHLPIHGVSAAIKTEALIMYHHLTTTAIKLAASEGPEAQGRLAASLFGRFA